MPPKLPQCVASSATELFRAVSGNKRRNFQLLFYVVFQTATLEAWYHLWVRFLLRYFGPGSRFVNFQMGTADNTLLIRHRDKTIRTIWNNSVFRKSYYRSLSPIFDWVYIWVIFCNSSVGSSCGWTTLTSEWLQQITKTKNYPINYCFLSV